MAKQKFRASTSQISSCEEELGRLVNEHITSKDAEFDFFLETHRELSIELEHLRSIKESCWYQKSRIKWFKKWDSNIVFLHKVASERRRINLITPGRLSLLGDASFREISTLSLSRLRID